MHAINVVRRVLHFLREENVPERGRRKEKGKGV